MKYTCNIAYFTETHSIWPIEFGILEFSSRAKTEKGLFRAAEKAAEDYVYALVPHATGVEVWNIR